MANISKEEFSTQYHPNVSKEEFTNQFRPQQGNIPSGNIDTSGIDPFTGPSSTEIDNTLAIIHRNYVQKGPFTGEVSDQLFNQGSAGRILSAFGHGFEDGWNGTVPSSLKFELDKEAKEKDKNLLTAVRNAAAKPAAAALDFITKSWGAGGSALAGTAEQTAAELHKPVELANPDSVLDKTLTYPFGMASELLSGIAHGALMEGGLEGHAGSVDHVQQVLEARSKGIIGEGEAGYFKVKPPTPEDVTAREEAAKQAGTWVPKLPEGAFVSTEDAIPTVHELAAQMDPDTFNELNRLTDLQENLRNSRDYLTSQLKEPSDPQYIYQDQQRIQRQLDELRNRPENLQKIDEQLRDLIPDVSSAKERARELLTSDSPDGARYRNLIQAQAFERALALQPVKAKAEEALRLANDLKETNEPPKTGPATPDKSSKTPPKINPKADKPPEVKVSPEAASGKPPLRKIQGTGEKTPLSLNKRLELDSVIKGWKSEVGEVPQEEVLKTEQQLIEAQRLADENLSLAKRIAMGDSEVPEGYNVHPEAVLRILKKRAEDTGDIGLGLKLADTRLAGEARTMGQRINLLKGMYDIDPVGIIHDLNEAWIKDGAKKINKVIKEIQEEVDKAIETFAPDMQAFLKSIECDE